MEQLSVRHHTGSRSSNSDKCVSGSKGAHIARAYTVAKLKGCVEYTYSTFIDNLPSAYLLLHNHRIACYIHCSSPYPTIYNYRASVITMQHNVTRTVQHELSGTRTLDLDSSAISVTVWQPDNKSGWSSCRLVPDIRPRRTKQWLPRLDLVTSKSSYL